MTDNDEGLEMKLRTDQVVSTLNKHLHPCYLVSGDVPLLVQECCEEIRRCAKAKGYTEHKIFVADNHFDWPSFVAELNALSLFSQQRLIELHLETNKINEQASKLLQQYLAQPAADTILLIISGKLDSKTQQTAWYRAIDIAGVIINAWPIEQQQMPQWLRQRLQNAGIETTPVAIQLLVDLVEGNLLAAVQAIEKLSLQYGKGKITTEQVADAVTDNARFDIFNLIDSCLAGDANRIVRIFNQLKDSATEVTLLVWGLARELRTLATLINNDKAGIPAVQSFRQLNIWDKRQPFVRQAIKRHSATTIQQLMQQLSHIDSMIKGGTHGQPWDELLKICLAIGGVALFKQDNSLSYLSQSSTG